MPIIDTSEIMGRSLPMSTPEDSKHLLLKIGKALDDQDDDLNSNHVQIRSCDHLKMIIQNKLSSATKSWIICDPHAKPRG